jgi:hypothetical protein
MVRQAASSRARPAPRSDNVTGKNQASVSHRHRQRGHRHRQLHHAADGRHGRRCRADRHDATLQIWGNTDEAGTFARLYDAGGSAADITLAPSATVATVYALPDAAFALPYTKIVAATTNSECVASVVVKS